VNAVRLIIDQPARGAWNMAVDEALLESASDGVATLRLYQWSEPTLSLGYFQAVAARAQHAASRQSPLVRRASGGGAIVHDRELTYSFATPIRARFGRQPAELYHRLHGTLIAALGELGVVAEMCQPASTLPADAAPFLCFQRRTRGDVLCGVVKIAGSAQRRHRGGLLQHGSVLLSGSPAAPELPGILEAAGVSLSAEELSERWTNHLALGLEASFQPGGCTDQQRRRAVALAESRYSSDAWNARR
jgi:lipoate-protein ligase A